MPYFIETTVAAWERWQPVAAALVTSLGRRPSFGTPNPRPRAATVPHSTTIIRGRPLRLRPHRPRSSSPYLGLLARAEHPEHRGSGGTRESRDTRKSRNSGPSRSRWERRRSELQCPSRAFRPERAIPLI